MQRKVRASKKTRACTSCWSRRGGTDQESYPLCEKLGLTHFLCEFLIDILLHRFISAPTVSDSKSRVDTNAACVGVHYRHHRETGRLINLEGAVLIFPLVCVKVVCRTHFLRYGAPARVLVASRFGDSGCHSLVRRVHQCQRSVCHCVWSRHTPGHL